LGRETSPVDDEKGVVGMPATLFAADAAAVDTRAHLYIMVNKLVCVAVW
jgi:hypothetical protein